MATKKTHDYRTGLRVHTADGRLLVIIPTKDSAFFGAVLNPDTDEVEREVFCVGDTSDFSCYRLGTDEEPSQCHSDSVREVRVKVIESVFVLPSAMGKQATFKFAGKFFRNGIRPVLVDED